MQQNKSWDICSTVVHVFFKRGITEHLVDFSVHLLQIRIVAKLIVLKSQDGSGSEAGQHGSIRHKLHVGF